MGAPDAHAVEAPADVGDLDDDPAVDPGLDHDRRPPVLLGVRDHLVEREHQVAGPVAEAVPAGARVDVGADLRDLGGIGPQRGPVMRLLLHPCLRS